MSSLSVNASIVPLVISSVIIARMTHTAGNPSPPYNYDSFHVLGCEQSVSVCITPPISHCCTHDSCCRRPQPTGHTTMTALARRGGPSCFPQSPQRMLNSTFLTTTHARYLLYGLNFCHTDCVQHCVQLTCFPDHHLCHTNNPDSPDYQAPRNPGVHVADCV